MLTNSLFNCPNKDTYPPFKNGDYLEEYFKKYVDKNSIKFQREYINALWTNFQIEHWFGARKDEMQHNLDSNVDQNKKYFCKI